MIPLLLAALPVTFGFTQGRSTGVQIAVDASQADESVARQVTYRRGEVIAFDSSNTTSTPAEIISVVKRDIQSAGINLVTATLDFLPVRQCPLRLTFWEVARLFGRSVNCGAR